MANAIYGGKECCNLHSCLMFRKMRMKQMFLGRGKSSPYRISRIVLPMKSERCTGSEAFRYVITYAQVSSDVNKDENSVTEDGGV
jgi:hypothetical protein